MDFGILVVKNRFLLEGGLIMEGGVIGIVLGFVGGFVVGWIDCGCGDVRRRCEMGRKVNLWIFEYVL